MKRLAALCSALLVSGCSTMRPAEYAFHAANVVDTLQTISIGQDSCYREVGPITRRVLGESPDDPLATVALMGAVSALHWLIGQHLDGAPRVLFDVLTAGAKLGTVAHNYNQGIEPFPMHTEGECYER